MKRNNKKSSDTVPTKHKWAAIPAACVLLFAVGLLAFFIINTKKVDTTTANTQVELSKIDVNDKERPYLYRFTTQKDLTYCFVGSVTAAGSVGITVTYKDGVVNQIVTRSKPGTEIGCFKASESSTDATVTLDIDRDMDPKELHIFNR